MKKVFSRLLPLLFVLGPVASQLTMAQNTQDEYIAVINHEEQYSIWPADQKIPKGWKTTGVRGNYSQCQEYIEEVWTDMRPLSVRRMKLADKTGYQVVINHEEQYSIWPVNKDLPRGWKSTGKQGTLAECTNYIEEVWTDMRPLSVRKSARRGN